MKFSSDDIANQTFETRFRGYDTHQVHEFLQGLAREWDHVRDELKRLGRESAEQSKELKEYRRRERSLHDALEMAKQVAEEVRHQAERDAELIVAEAELKAERILAGVENRLSGMRDEMLRVQQQRIRFEAELRSTLESHRKMLDLFSPPDSFDESEYEELSSDEVEASPAEMETAGGDSAATEKMHRPG